MHEQRRPAGVGGQASGLGGRGLKRAYHGGPDRDHATATCATGGDGGDGRFWTGAVFGVDAEVLHAFGIDRLEGAGTDGEVDVRGADAEGGDLLQQRPGQVEAGGRRGDGARGIREHRLV